VKCLYKDKPCSRCGQTIKIGDECDYDGDTKTVSHPFRCVEERPSAEQFALAERLGFLSPDDALQQLWSTVFILSGGNRVDGARGSSPAYREQGALWSVPSSIEGEE
jgi:hypothetical protein